MNTIQIIVIACILGAIGLITLWWGAKTAHDLDQEEEYIAPPRFKPRKVTDLSKGTMGMDPIDKPKRKKKRYYNKKKPAVANNAPTEKRPVGRPRKTT